MMFDEVVFVFQFGFRPLLYHRTISSPFQQLTRLHAKLYFVSGSCLFSTCFFSLFFKGVKKFHPQSLALRFLQVASLVTLSCDMLHIISSSFN